MFHFFRFCVLNTVKQSDNFRYRIYRDEVINIDDFPASYTVINGDDHLNYTRCEQLAQDLAHRVASMIA